MQLSVMAPLYLKTDQDWEVFCKNLYTVQDNYAKVLRNNQKDPKSHTVAVSTDIWWGEVQNEQKYYKWEYYDRIAWTLKCLNNERPGMPELVWIPIMSFHQCGGNVNDDILIPIPEWAINNRKYLSDKGNECNEVISLWNDEEVINHYINFIREFSNRYGNQSKTFSEGKRPPKIIEINISCGPAGELRYPSYNSHDNFVYPHYGVGQASQQKAINHYKAFKKSLEFEQNNRIFEVKQSACNANNYIENHSYYKTKEGQDYFRWYNNCLIQHGQRMIQALLDGIDRTPLFNCRIGIKLPGIHWNSANNPAHPRLGEILSGLISPSGATSFNNQPGYLTDGYLRLIWSLCEPDDMNEKFTNLTTKEVSYYDKINCSLNSLYIPGGYNFPCKPGISNEHANLLKNTLRINKRNNKKFEIPKGNMRENLSINIHFTCGEMPIEKKYDKTKLNSVKEKEFANLDEWAGENWKQNNIGDHFSVNPYSKPKSLVTHVGWCGHQISEEIRLNMGIENALPFMGSAEWDNIDQILSKETYGDEFYKGKKTTPYNTVNILRVDTAAGSGEKFPAIIVKYS